MGILNDVTIYKCDGCGREIRVDNNFNSEIPEGWIERTYSSETIRLSMDQQYFEIDLRKKCFCQAECFALFVQDAIKKEIASREEARKTDQEDL